ncbi:MAG: hypothetical protein ACFFD4_02685 [Candidatus Odinarchaeota archaeon]
MAAYCRAIGSTHHFSNRIVVNTVKAHQYWINWWLLETAVITGLFQQNKLVVMYTKVRDR